MSQPRSVVIHGHYYQPPREDPWLDEVAREPSAAPHHDWNVRIEQECYRAVAAARVAGAGGRIARIVNALAWSSFDAAPTLLTWLEREAPDTFAAVVSADAASRARLGFGNAVAAPYHHIILPLATRRDKITEVRWGIADFRTRFGREPEGLWLPETAVDDETLDVLAAEGIAFTILAPHQVETPPPGGRPGRYRTSGGRTIALFCYDGDLSHDVAFGPLVRDAAAWTARLTRDATTALASVAVDGETFGHHHRFGEMALATVLDACAARPDVQVENFASYLARHPAEHEVTLVAPSAWSCPHGVERWRSNCGCRMEPGRAWQQGWRTPLRQAMDWLAAEVHALCDGAAPGDDEVAAREREWMERHALAAFSSCGWFFDDLAGLEPVLVMRQAARAIELAGVAAPRLEAGLLERLARGVSNDAGAGDGARIYSTRARPAVAAPDRVAAAAAALARLGLSGVRLPRGYASAVGGAAVTVTDVRTGRAWRFETATEGLASRPPGVVVRRDGGADLLVDVADFPEAARDAVRRTLARATAGDVPGADAAGHDNARLAVVLGTALVDAVRELATGGGDMRRATSLAAALGLLDAPIPFDAQTTFYRWREAMPPEQAAVLSPLAYALGFTG